MAASGTGYMKRIKPATAPLDKQPPTPVQLAVSSNLLSYLDRVSPLESPRAREHRMKVISTIRELCEAWVISTALSKRLIEHEMDAKNLAVKLYLSGSVRLGVNDEGGDIDAICVAPRGITREDFFAGMPDRLRAHRLVSEVNPLPEAGVPIIECVVGDLPVDLLFSTCQYVTMPPGGFQILDDKILANLDPASVKTLNGPRVTELTIQLVPNFPTFQVVLRAARHWARRRGIYSNKAGYLGGVNLAILSAWACQLYPAAAPAVVMTQMFRILSEWPWPRSIMLCEPYQNAMLSQIVWDPVTDRNQRRATMPIITPAYPAANSTFNVGWSNLAVMHREFCRARDICVAAWAQIKRAGGSAGARELPDGLWEPLFRPSEFFVEFDLYLAIDVWVDDGDDEAMSRWQNYVESRVREVVRCLEAERLALEFVYNWPKPVEWVRKVHEDEKALGPARVSAQRIARAEAEREAKKQADGQEAAAQAKTQAAKPGQKRKRGAASEEEEEQDKEAEAAEAVTESGADPRADPDDGEEQKMATFFVGLALDEARLRNRSLDLRRVDGLFTRALKLKYRASLQPSMHVEERLLSWRELPAEAFGTEGRAAAAARRAALKSVELAQGGPSWRKHALPISKEAKVQSGGQGYLGSGFGGQTSLTRWVSRAEGAGAEEAAGLHPVPRAVAAAGVLSGEVPARIRESEAVQADLAETQLPFPMSLCEAVETEGGSDVAVPGIPQASRDASSQAAGGILMRDEAKGGLPGLV